MISFFYNSYNSNSEYSILLLVAVFVLLAFLLSSFHPEKSVVSYRRKKK